MDIDTRPSLMVRLTRQEWYGADRYALDPAQPPRVLAPPPPPEVAQTRYVCGAHEPQAQRPSDAAPSAELVPPERGADAAGEADASENATPRDTGPSFGGGPSDIQLGGMLDVFA